MPDGAQAAEQPLGCPRLRTWSTALLAYAGAVAGWGFLTAAIKAAGFDLLRTMMVFPAISVCSLSSWRPRDTVLNSLLLGSWYGAVAFLPVIGLVRTGKKVWLFASFAIVMGSALSCLVYLQFFFDMPVPD